MSICFMLKPLQYGGITFPIRVLVDLFSSAVILLICNAYLRSIHCMELYKEKCLCFEIFYSALQFNDFKVSFWLHYSHSRFSIVADYDH